MNKERILNPSNNISKYTKNKKKLLMIHNTKKEVNFKPLNFNPISPIYHSSDIKKYYNENFHTEGNSHQILFILQ